MSDICKMTDAELDEAVAVEVMGWKESPCWTTCEVYLSGMLEPYQMHGVNKLHVFRPSLDYECAEIVIRKLGHSDLTLVFGENSKDPCQIIIYRQNMHPIFYEWNLRDKSISRAICEAALKAVRAGQQDVNG